MTMPASGPLNLGGTSTPVSVAQELGRTLTAAISMNDAAVRTLAGAGASGTSWSMSSLYGKSNRAVIAITISASTQNYVLNTAKAAGYVAGKTDVTLTINAGVYVGSSSTAGIGLDVDTSWAAGDTVTIVNNGFIVGCGGNGNYSGTFNAPAAGSAAGPALRVQRATSISNAGTIGGGGGGGGQGGSQSGGDYGTPAVGGRGGGGQGYAGGSPNGGVSGPGAGSAGGYSQSSYGYAGTGGTGGTWGAAGNSGSWPSSGYGQAPAGGGAGGNCTTAGSNANITWISTGTRLGTIA